MQKKDLKNDHIKDVQLPELCLWLECPKCLKSMEQVDTTYSNTKTSRSEVGQHTGDIYFCENCEQHYIDNLLTGKVEAWSY